MKQLPSIALLMGLAFSSQACESASSEATAPDVVLSKDTVSTADAASIDTSTADGAQVDAGTPTEDVAAAVDTGPEPPPKVCHDGTVFTGQPSFTDVTQLWGLQDGEAPVHGIRLGAVDLDGDGYADLVVRGHTVGEHESFAPGDPRRTYVLMNREGPSGQRTFVDATEESGLLALPDGGNGRTAHVVVFGDVDNDGDLDAYSGVAVSPDPSTPDNGDRNEILLNNGDGTFVLGPGGDLRHPDQRYTVGGASFLDFDRDGILDLFVGYGNGLAQPDPDRLYMGDGKGSFTDVTAATGLMTKIWSSLDVINSGAVHRNTWGVTVCDVDDDGFPDLLSSTYGRFFDGLWMGGSTGGTPWFEDRMMQSGFGMDERTDWTTNYNAQCFCKLVPDAEDCDGVPPPPAFFSCTSPDKLRWNHDFDREPFRLGGNTFSTACGDIDNDGDMDLMNFEIVHWDVGPSSDPTELLVNDGGGTFTRPGAEATGIVRDFGIPDWNAGDMTGAFFDFDNDGRKDIYIGSSDYPGTRGFLFHQKADGTFEEVLPAKGIDHPRSHGVAIADFDRDGDLDIAVGHGTSRCAGDSTCYPTQEVHVFRNDLGQAGNFVQIELVGADGSNRSAIGAKIQVTAGGVTQTQEVSGGYGHYGIQHDLVQHFGLGPACDIDEVRVYWPDEKRTQEAFLGVQGNTRVRIVQGSPIISYY